MEGGVLVAKLLKLYNILLCICYQSYSAAQLCVFGTDDMCCISIHVCTFSLCLSVLQA